MLARETIPALHCPPPPTAQLHLASPHTFYGEPHASPITSEIHTQCAEAEFEEKYYYLNHTYHDLTLMKRDGLCMSLGHTASQSSCDFVVRRMVRLKSKALMSTMAALAHLSGPGTSELSEIKKCLSHVDTGRFAEACLMLDYVITLDELKARGGTLYHQPTDTVLSLKGVFDVELHPYSARFLNIGAFGQTQEYTNQKELNFKIRLVDHSNAATPRYLNFAGKVFKLMPQKDAPHRRITSVVAGKTVERTYADYVQVFYSAKNDMSVVNHDGAECVQYTLAEARDLMGLCDNVHDATNPGRLDAERKRALGVMTHELELLKGENMRERAQLEREDLDRREALACQNHELELARLETSRQKQEVEALSTSVQLELAAAKQAQSKLDADMQRLDNDKRAVDLQRKVQDETLERERREFDEKTKRLREEQEARLRNESLYWKEFYEMRALQRKDTSDFVKFIPGLLIGVGGIAAAWLKFSAPPKAA